MNSILLDNFRCFDNLEIKLKPGVNLLIGDNASGKTSLLKACSYAAQAFFSGFSDEFTVWKTPQKEDFRVVIVGEKRINSKPIEISFTYDAVEMPGIEAFASSEELQTIFKKSAKNSRPLVSRLKGIRKYGAWLHENLIVEDAYGNLGQLHPLPLFAAFSTHGIHNKPSIDSRAFDEYSQTPSFGYYLCTHTDGLLEHWVRRMLILQEANRNPDERGAVLKALRTLFGPDGCGVLSSIDVRVNLKDLVCVFNDGREIPTAWLSDGYLRLFNIAIDLAFRCTLLNGLKYGKDACLETRGTVIIDEIDLHLHPSLQGVALNALHKAFPKLQFIVSTHAPMVMTGVDSNEENAVFHMKYSEGNYLVEEVDTYGMDMSTIADAVLSLPRRDKKVQDKLDFLASLIDGGRIDEAREMLNRMQARFGERIPELSGMDTQIFLNDSIGDDIH